jgi:hypothetical protein
MVYWRGYNGIPLAYIISMLLTTPWLIYGLGKQAMGKLTRALLWISMPIGISGIGGWMVQKIGMGLKVECFAIILTVSTAYAISTYIFGPQSVKSTIAQKVLKVSRGRINMIPQAAES